MTAWPCLCAGSYAGPVFRFDRAGGGRCRQFIQVGAEIIGDYSSRSDAEIIGSAIEGLQRLGLPSTSVRLGHVETLSRLFAAFELSDSARRFVTGNLGGLKRGRTTAGRLLERAREAGLVDEETPSIDGWGAKRAREALQLLILEEGARGPMGRRTAEEIMARLERKSGQSRDPVEMGRALDLASRLVGLEGPASQTLADARAVASRSGARTDALDPLEELVEALAESGIGTNTLVVDMGMARGMAYYTGALFDLAAGQGAGTLGGGGRYDGASSDSRRPRGASAGLCLRHGGGLLGRTATLDVAARYTQRRRAARAFDAFHGILRPCRCPSQPTQFTRVRSEHSLTQSCIFSERPISRARWKRQASTQESWALTDIRRADVAGTRRC